MTNQLTEKDLRRAILDVRKQLKDEQATLEDVYRLQHNLARKQHAYDMYKKFDKHESRDKEKQHATFIARHDEDVSKLDEKATAYYDLGASTVGLLVVTLGQMIEDLFKFRGMTDDNALTDAHEIFNGLAEFRMTDPGSTHPLSHTIDQAVDKITTVEFWLYGLD